MHYIISSNEISQVIQCYTAAVTLEKTMQNTYGLAGVLQRGGVNAIIELKSTFTLRS